jgi:hypothetical protein
MPSVHSIVEERLVGFLHERGFPEAAIVRDPEFKTPDGQPRARPDLVLTNPDTREPLTILEVKSDLRSDKHDRIRAQVESYAQIFSDIPTYLVTDGPEPLKLAFYRFNRETKQLEEFSPEKFPSLPAMLGERITARQVAIASVTKEREDTSRTFYWFCFLLAAMAFFTAVTDFYLKEAHSIELLTAPRLGLIGAAFGIAILPFVQKFKGLGIEYERLTHESKRK